jgi:hypothetical protein
MKKSRRAAYGIAWALLLSSSYANADVAECQFLMQQGIFNKLEIRSSADDRKVDITEFCRSSSSSSSGGFSVGYGGFTLGASQQKAVADAVCNKTFSESELKQRAEELRLSVDPGLMNVVTTCLNASGGGLNVKYDQRTSDLLIMTLLFTEISGKAHQVELYHATLHGNIACAGQFYDQLAAASLQAPIVFDARIGARILQCERNDRTELYEADGKPKLMQGGHVVLDTTVGPVVGEIPPRYAQNNTFDERLSNLERRLKNVEKVEVIGPFEFQFNRQPTPVPNSTGAKFCALTKGWYTHDATAGVGLCRVFVKDGVWMTMNDSNGNGYGACEVTCWK